MASRRMIASDIFEDEFFCELTHVERLLWIGIIAQCADDQGRLQDRPKMINSRVFPNDEISVSEIERGLESFAKNGKITRYEGGGKKLIQIVKWWVYQTPAWASPSKFQPPDGWVDRTKYHAAGNEVISENWKSAGGYVVDYVANANDESAQLHSGIEDGDVNGEGNGNGEDEGNAKEPRQPQPEEKEIIHEVYTENIGKPTKIILEEMDNYIDELGHDTVNNAIKEAARNNVLKWAYIRSILEAWKEKGRRDQRKHEYAEIVYENPAPMVDDETSAMFYSAMQELKSCVAPSFWENWIKSLFPVSFIGNQFIIGARNQYVIDQVSAYSENIRNVICSGIGRSIEIKFEVR